MSLGRSWGVGISGIPCRQRRRRGSLRAKRSSSRPFRKRSWFLKWAFDHHKVIVAEKKDNIYGVLSLILYTMILIPMIKYIFIVLLADNNSDGGTFALYTLISRYAKVSLIPNEQAEDAMRSNYKLETISPQMKRAQWIKRKLEGSIVAKYILFLLTVLGNSMVIGDGILTPCISVLSAVSGIK